MGKQSKAREGRFEPVSKEEMRCIDGSYLGMGHVMKDVQTGVLYYYRNGTVMAPLYGADGKILVDKIAVDVNDEEQNLLNKIQDL